MKILFNNEFINKNEAKVSMLSESFMYGFGSFETIRTYKKVPFKIDEHIGRLEKSSKRIGLKLNHDSKEIKIMINKVVQKSNKDNQRIKVIHIKEGILITSIELEENQEVIDRGVSCKSVNCIRSYPEVKSISYLNSYLSHNEAVKADSYDAILIDKTGEVYEGAYSNIFWFEEDKLCTRKNDVLEGITRNIIIEISPFPIEYKTINIKELKKQNEVFLTQTTKGIVPITEIDKTAINNKKVGEKTKTLIEKYGEHIGKYVESQN